MLAYALGGYIEPVSTTPALVIDLAGIARLAGVQRPVVSTWRSRFATAADPFPAPIAESNGRLQFDGHEVAGWLARTGHGHNMDALKDVAVSATPPGFSYAHASAVAQLEALIALSALRDGLADLTSSSIEQAAAECDPHDLMLLAEIAKYAAGGQSWLAYADSLIDASYSPSETMAHLHRRSAGASRTAGSSGFLSHDAIALVQECIIGLIAQSEATVIIDSADAELSSALAAAIPDQAVLAVPNGPHARRIRRRLRAAGHWFECEEGDGSRAIRLARLVPGPGGDASETLRALDEVSLAMRPTDAAVVIGPASALTDAMQPILEQSRADVLRSGRVRGIVRLKAGLIGSATRESLALWVLGGRGEDLGSEPPLTAIADLTGRELTPATRADLISDLMFASANSIERRGHSFRFVAFVPTTTLQAREGSLVALARAHPNTTSRPATGDIPALLDIAADAIRDDHIPAAVVVDPHQIPEPASISTLIESGHLRMIQGTRLAAGIEGSDGLIVIKPAGLDDQAQIGDVRVNQLDFAVSHPTARLTEPGDVVFRTSPTAAAWVDPDGYKIVSYPARILRVVAADPGGLIPEIVADDIRGAQNGPASWKKWIVRRVAPDMIAPLRTELGEIARAQAALTARVSGLEEYAALVVAGATAGAIRITSRPTNENTTEK